MIPTQQLIDISDVPCLSAPGKGDLQKLGLWPTARTGILMVAAVSLTSSPLPLSLSPTWFSKSCTDVVVNDDGADDKQPSNCRLRKKHVERPSENHQRAFAVEEVGCRNDCVAYDKALVRSTKVVVNPSQAVDIKMADSSNPSEVDMTDEPQGKNQNAASRLLACSIEIRPAAIGLQGLLAESSRTASTLA
ncbi:hypothetical protein CERZMDRAFT_88038 [Cercospora zeae-maydis SCOH1-5]|uniref:Uncharacterized protein n=1 Tax=Cercospora zeae-maydis SCOH1-5 TaxID=717836 RepID=A0A6A6F474_9PEZI|nr:hypothetical protein CERZMDRAFT_88038 [Cercospora zeae-maydis SCOH1-5]